MSILIDQKSRIIVQGIKGRTGSLFSKRMHDYSHNVVGGIAPSHGGEWVLDGKVPLFDTVKECVQSTDADTSVIFVPAYAAADAIFEAIDAGIKIIVCISAGVPLKDISLIKSALKYQDTVLIGPNAAGVVSPGKALAGVFPTELAIEGHIGVISRAGALAYDVLQTLYKSGLGVSTAVGLGEDVLSGASFVDCLEMFEMDAHTDSILLVGQPGDIQEELAARYILESVTKPVFAYIAGENINQVQIIGHTDIAMFDMQHCSQNKIEILARSGVRIARRISDIPGLYKSKKPA